MIHLKSKVKCCDGFVEYYNHDSHITKTKMNFSVFVPVKAQTEKVPVLFWLSGLTCTEENFMMKAHAQAYANEAGLMIVCPDTSPRGANIDGEDVDWDFGTGAGFYVNATQDPWKQHYHMYDYVMIELMNLIKNNFPADMNRLAISGHSMGGHGALVMALRNPNVFKSVSAFAPICAPMQVPWGQKAFEHYLGSNQDDWRAYDACELIKDSSDFIPMLIDQGSEDSFLEEQLKTSLLQKVCEDKHVPAKIRMQSGYDHSYYFIASFIQEHIRFHQSHLM